VIQMKLTVVISYLFMTCYFFFNWLKFSLRNPTASPEDKFLSFVMFLITTVLWPLVIPISFIDNLKNKKFELSTIVPALLLFFALSLSLYLS
jgi:hypothetical protein